VADRTSRSLNVHPATSAHGVAEGANQLLRHQTVLPDIASAISLIFIPCPSRRRHKKGPGVRPGLGWDLVTESSVTIRTIIGARFLHNGKLCEIHNDKLCEIRCDICAQ
jgi:hypothetical protein